MKSNNSTLPTLEYFENIGLELCGLNETFLGKSGNEIQEKIVYKNLYEAFENIINDGFYYPYYVGSNVRLHGHTFDEIVKALYDFPNAFCLKKEDLSFYSDQEQAFLKKLKYYLIFIGLKDKKEYSSRDEDNQRIQNVKNENYKVVNEKYAKEIFEGKIKSVITKYFDYHFKTEEINIVFDEDNNLCGLLKKIKKVVAIDDLTSEDIDYKVRGFDSLDKYKEHLTNEFSLFDKSCNKQTKCVISKIEILKQYEQIDKFIMD